MADRTLLKERLQQAAEVTAPARRLDDVVRRARVLRWRRAGATALVACVVTAAFVASLSALQGLDANDHHTAGGGVGAIGFEPATGWNMAANAPASPDWPPTVWVTNVPFAQADLEGTRTKDGVVRMDAGPEVTYRQLPADGIVIAADIIYVSRNPLPPSDTFPPRVLPLRLPESPPETSWEGSIGGQSLHGVGATVNGHWVSVRIRYGTEDPGDAMLAEAQAELARLFVEPAPAATDDIDQFGISSALPADWHGRLFAWTGGPPTLELSTLPIERLSGDTAIPNRERLGALDASIVLAESDTTDLGFPSTTLPLSIREQDRCDCEVLDDGTTPPDGHTLFHRSFETGGRSFDLYVEFGSATPTPSDWNAVNDLLASIVIAGAPTAEAPTTPIVTAPKGWFVQRNPLPPLVDPRTLVAVGSWDFPRPPLIACGPQPALQAMPSNGSFFWIVEYRVAAADPSALLRKAPPWPERFGLDLPSRPGDHECAAGTDGSVRQYLFRGTDRYVQILVALGSDASLETRQAVEDTLSSFDA